VLYTYCYALTAVWLRRLCLPKLPSGYTWIVLFVLLGGRDGGAVPHVLSGAQPPVPATRRITALALLNPGRGHEASSPISAVVTPLSILSRSPAFGRTDDGGELPRGSCDRYAVSGRSPSGTARSQEPPTLTIPPGS